MPGTYFIVDIPKKTVIEQADVRSDIDLPSAVDREPGVVEQTMQRIEIDVQARLRFALATLQVRRDMWVEDLTKKRYQVTFPADENEEAVLTELERNGIGTLFGSVALVPVNVMVVHKSEEELEESKKRSFGVRNRLLVYQVIQQILLSAQLSFDNIVLVVVASLLAGSGLAVNSSVVVVASMLVSPLMGPILAITFGTKVRNWPMVALGLRVEALMLLACVLTGMVVGLFFAPFGWQLQWPNVEMASRGEPSALLVGLTIAIPSGIGVAISLLSANTASLVGVAISASLLPPAVNTGMNFAYAMLGTAFHGNPVDSWYHVRVGVVSFFLTILNIICIYIFAMIMLKIKDVQISKDTPYRRSMKHAEEYTKTLRDDDRMEANLQKKMKAYKLLLSTQRDANINGADFDLNDAGIDSMSSSSLTSGSSNSMNQDWKPPKDWRENF